MREEVLMAGTGGQGVLLAGQVLAEAALKCGLEVSFYPSYTPEVRGGRANSTVIIADGPVGSPLAGSFGSLVLMDKLALSEHLARLKPGGLLLVNSTLCGEEPTGADARVIRVPAHELAVKLATERAVNMVMIGAYVAASGIVSLDALEAALKAVLPERHHSYIPMNLAAIAGGAEAVQSA